MNSKELTAHERVQATFSGTVELLKAATPIKNVILETMDRSPIEEALAVTYYRMFLLIESLTRLTSPLDVQVAAHCARCLYELRIDVSDLIRNPSLVGKFEAFPFVARFAAAKKLVNEIASQGITDPMIGKHERRFVADVAQQNKFQAALANHWPNMNNAPLNWTGKTMADRATAVGSKEAIRYRQLYSLFSWHSHAGVVGIAGISTDGLESTMGLAHAHSQDFFEEATLDVGGKFDVFRANPELEAPIRAYKVRTVEVLTKMLNEKEAAV